MSVGVVLVYTLDPPKSPKLSPLTLVHRKGNGCLLVIRCKEGMALLDRDGRVARDDLPHDTSIGIDAQGKRDETQKPAPACK